MIRLFAVALAAAMILVVAGCGDDDAETTTTAAPEDTSMATESETVVVTAIDFAYLDLPDEVPVGTTLTLHNDSEVELHELVAIRLPDDETRPVRELIQLPPEELEGLFPNVETVVIAPPGSDGFPVEGTGTLTEPGRYAIICAIPTGADPQEYMEAAQQAEDGPPEVEGGPPHFVQGMFGEVTVVG